MSKLTADGYLVVYACDDTGKEIFNFVVAQQTEINHNLGTEGDDVPLTFVDAEDM